MKVLRRILIGSGMFVTFVLILVFWAFPVGLSIWTIWKAPSVARVVPTELKDNSISQATCSKFRYFGYEFELPWNDMDTAQEVSSNRVALNFHSGLQVSVTGLPKREFVNSIANSWFNMSPQVFEAKLGHEATRSDYEFLKRLYARTPEKMNLWAVYPSVHYRDVVFVHIKSHSLLPWAADSGVFNIENQGYKGFQQGRPESRPVGIVVDLYADEGGVEFIFNQKDYRNARGVSQPEINRVIQSLRSVSSDGEGR